LTMTIMKMISSRNRRSTPSPTSMTRAASQTSGSQSHSIATKGRALSIAGSKQDPTTDRGKSAASADHS